MSFCLPFFRSSSATREFQEDNRTDYLEKLPSSLQPFESPTLQGDLLKNEARERLCSLRTLMQDNKSEFTTEADQRRRWISGFTGSAGTAVVGKEKAYMFVDSRYWVQAAKQLSSEWTLIKMVGRDAEGWHAWWQWCENNVEDHARIGIDPKLITLVLVNTIEPKLNAKSISLVQINDNLIDAIRPVVERSLSPVTLHPLKFSGCPTQDKLASIRDKLFTNHPENGVYILPVLPSIVWLLNIRCQNDVPNTPIFRSYVTLTRTECVIYADKRKFSPNVEESLKRDGVRLEAYGIDEVKKYIVGWKASADGEKRKVLAPPSVSWGMVHTVKMAITVSQVRISRACTGSLA
ncbi:hypothetical protein QFC22_001601 [Naganishia vaughanmartiniae]|uniref:Uncharacterized protein n=1 Tax=Naganishia vaughanmartiniae TaxID=1424756 RepID=A0ACC2XH89_9TREE|nr:hypothetical protein QFC22_001601 [Naganishia vaughanmartiniae]